MNQDTKVTTYKLIQYRDTIGQTDPGFVLGIYGGLKKAKGARKEQFHSHMEMLLKHEQFGYDNWEVDEENYILRATIDDIVMYEYRLEIEEPVFIGERCCSVCGIEVAGYDA